MKTMKASCLTLLLGLSLAWALPALAWDAVGHRLTAAVAMNIMSETRRAELLEILAQHPRYRQDFLEAMPGFVRDDPERRAQWLLGQAAYWPDIARGLPEAERLLYNRSTWHYTDGAWVRDSAPLQGNTYVGIDRFPDIPGEAGTTISAQSQVHNVVTALDYNTRVLADPGALAPERAVALCWVLHLMGDIHQPLHTGSLFSSRLFADGDRGGNGIPIAGGDNLHSRWDGALRDEGVAASLPLIMEQLAGFGRLRIMSVESDWSAWMAESRQLLQTVVYSEDMKADIAAADQARRQLDAADLSADYVAQMKRYARQRIGLAGLRLAIWFENELPG